MMAHLRRGSEYSAAALDLFACLAGFGIAGWAFHAWLGVPQAAEPWLVQWLASAAIAWLAIVFPENGHPEGLPQSIDRFFTAAGSNLLVQYGLTYLFGLPAASWFVIVLGSVLSVAAGALLHGSIPLAPAGARAGTLLLGSDPATAALAAALGDAAVGLLASGPPDLCKSSFLGPPDRLDEVCESQRPRAVLVSGKPAVSLARLLGLYYRGIDVEGAPFLSETALQRVAWQQLSPSDLLFSVTPVTSRAMLAFQAIYKNLAGLGLMVLFAPVLILLSLLIALSAGGRALEQIECLGVQRVPFQMFRFRTVRRGGGSLWIGSLIERLHLTNLPQLMNVFRGEMALFGPRPVRAAFAGRLEQLIPPYAYRFVVKPGILGWAQARFAESGTMPEEALGLEYDFYYIRQESPSLDLDILLRTLFRRSGAEPEAAAPRAAVDS